MSAGKAALHRAVPSVSNGTVLGLGSIAKGHDAMGYTQVMKSRNQGKYIALDSNVQHSLDSFPISV